MPRVNKNKRRPITNKKKKGKNKKSSAAEYMDKLAPNIPSNPNEFMAMAAGGILNEATHMANLYHNDRDAIKDTVKPMDVTTSVLKKIHDLPTTSEGIIWFVDLHMENNFDASIMDCCIHLVNDEYREHHKNREEEEILAEENYNIDNEKNRLTIHLGHCAKIYGELLFSYIIIIIYIGCSITLFIH